MHQPHLQAIILLGLAIGCHSQGAPQAAGGEAAPEPYSYSYETDTHAASEQRDPSGTVQGFYTLCKYHSSLDEPTRRRLGKLN